MSNQLEYLDALDRLGRDYDWAQTRPIEEMTWAPVLSADTMEDASQSILHSPYIELGQSGGRLSLMLPKSPFRLSVSGDLSRFSATYTSLFFRR